MSESPRVQRLLQKYAPILGGGIRDANGVLHDFGPNTEAKQRQHLFYTKNNELENSVVHLMLGDVIPGLIRDECHDIEYIGLHKDAMMPDGPDLTKEQKAAKAKLEKFKKLQLKQIEENRIAKEEAQGIFRDPEPVQ